VKSLTRTHINSIRGKNNSAGSAVNSVIIFHGMGIIYTNTGDLVIETINKTNHNTRNIR
jgi:hypothetical protein